MTSEIGCIQSLWRYPVRSMRGEELTAAEITSRGVVGDRCYCVVDLENDRAAEASYVPIRWAGLLLGAAAFTTSPHADTTPPPVTIRFDDGSQRTSDDPDLSEWLNERLGHPAALWRDTDAGGAALAGGEAEATGSATESVAGAEPPDAPARGYDRSPIHLVTTASLKRATALHPKGRFDPAALPTQHRGRHRRGGGPFWKRSGSAAPWLSGPELRIEVSEASGRCSVPTLPQGDLKRDPKILATVGSAQRRPHGRVRAGRPTRIASGRRSRRAALDDGEPT